MSNLWEGLENNRPQEKGSNDFQTNKPHPEENSQHEEEDPEITKKQEMEDR